jgi:dUTP pyrophosphatase
MKATIGSSGYDITAVDNYLIPPLDIYRIRTGLKLWLQPGWEAQIRGRSGKAYSGLIIHPGTIDSDYRGEIIVIAYNFLRTTMAISDGDRIAQLVIAPVTMVEWEEVDHMPATERGEGGFGSTGE